MTVKCKLCGKEVADWLSYQDEHLWTFHREIIMKFIHEQFTGGTQ